MAIAQRDMSDREFKAALKRNEFEKVLFWLNDVSEPRTGCSYGCVYTQRTGKIDRRASLARAIQQRAADRKTKARLAAVPA